jgi:type VI secretion system secreted protein Hcp
MRKVKLAGAGLLVATIAGAAATIAFARPSVHSVSSPLPANAGVGQITIDGIRGGDSVETSKIEIESWSWGMSQSGTFSTPGRANVHDLTIAKTLDKASPLLYKACAEQQPLDQVTLEIFRPASSSDVYMTIKMENVIVSSVQPGGSGAAPTESISFNFQKVTFKYAAKNGSTVQSIIVNPSS